MIDIWMLFTMTVPFLEVALHTFTEVMGRPGMAQFSPDGRVSQVKPVEKLEMEVPQPKVLPAWVGVVGRLLLPIISILFTATFWTVGLVVSFLPTTQQDKDMADCLNIGME